MEMPWAVHPSVYILEEMAERGWDRDLMAWCMVLGTGKRDQALAAIAKGPAYDAQVKEWQITRLSLDLYFDVGPTEPTMRLGEMAARFSRAFGTSPNLFTNLERSWLATQSLSAPVAAPTTKEK